MFMFQFDRFRISVPRRLFYDKLSRPAAGDIPTYQMAEFSRAQLAKTWGPLGETSATVAVCGLVLLALSAAAPWRLAALAPVAVGAIAWAASRFGERVFEPPARVVLGHRVVAALALLVGTALGTAIALISLSLDNDRSIWLPIVAMGGLVGGSILGPKRRLDLFFAVPVCLLSCIGLAFQGRGLSLAGALVLPIFAVWPMSMSRRRNAEANGRILADLRIAEQDAMIQDLLLDFDENTSDWLWRTDAKGRLVSFDGGAVATGPFASDEFRNVLERASTSGSTQGARAILASTTARKPFRDQLVELKSGGTVLWFRLSGKPVFENGQFAGFRGVGSDMTGARESESRIAYLANHDVLTGFANRANFKAIVDRDCVTAVRDGQCRALLCIDLDGFKSVNDGLGHAGGDEVLTKVSARLTAALPSDAFVARLGGDEFAVWLPGTTPNKAEAAARKASDAIGTPFEVDGVQVDIGASVGIAFAPKHGSDLDELLRKADLALYRAKAEGKGRVCVFEESFETILKERRKLENDLKLAIGRNEFVLHYQPLVDTITGRVVSFEALIRWRSPDRGFVSPGDFIPAAEAAGLISPIGRWALFEACRTAATWPDDIKVAVNVSPPQMRSAEFCHEVLMALKTSGLNPSRLVIEVTEGLFLDKSQDALTTLKALRDRGIMIALDDFGTGYSSLRYLVDFPVDKIKIDRSFVADLLNSEANQAIVDAILGLARKLSIRVTAEGIETKEQALALKLKRCDDLQGYLLSKPRPAADVMEMLASAPANFREAVPTHMDSPLAMALAVRRQAAG